MQLASGKQRFRLGSPTQNPINLVVTATHSVGGRSNFFTHFLKLTTYISNIQVWFSGKTGDVSIISFIGSFADPLAEMADDGKNTQPLENVAKNITCLGVQLFFIFSFSPPIWGRFPIWLRFSKIGRVETTLLLLPKVKELERKTTHTVSARVGGGFLYKMQQAPENVKNWGFLGCCWISVDTGFSQTSVCFLYLQLEVDVTIEIGSMMYFLSFYVNKNGFSEKMIE